VSLKTRGKNDFSVKIVEHDGSRLNQSQLAIYAALSHCWGANRSCVTTKHNLEERLKDIPWDTIPRTFQDAIRLALLLNIRQIWIDSLCIIQDDLEDWNIESAKMADIYQLAALTLAATGSRGDSHGCFSEALERTKDVELSLPTSKTFCRIAVRNAIMHWDTDNERMMKERFPLMSRGWAFQERLLSPRILHFCESELVWECRELSVCECGGLKNNITPGGVYYRNMQAGQLEWHDNVASREEHQTLTIDEWEADNVPVIETLDSQSETGKHGRLRSWISSVHHPRLRRTFLRSTVRRLENQTGESSSPTYPMIAAPRRSRQCGSAEHRYTDDLGLPPPELRTLPRYVSDFHRVIEQYSGLQLSHLSDRLPALSGLCERIQHIRGYYAAGLWADSLCFDLMWRVDRLRLDLTHHENNSWTYRGPSWSWVAVEDPVTYWPDIFNFDEYGRDYQKIESPHVCLGLNTQRIKVVCQAAGKNTFGNVKIGASITVTAATSTSARLQYTYHLTSDNRAQWMSPERRQEVLDLYRYKLVFVNLDPRDRSSALWIKPAEPVEEDEFELPFYADYPLAAAGPRQLLNGTPLRLILVHPRVSLVLVERRDQSYERIGIARMSDDAIHYYDIDWMRHAYKDSFTIH
jgi:hypothetical protein